MTEPSVTQQVKEAKAAVRKLRRPDNISKLVWPRVQRALHLLCDFLPYPYPGMRLIAHRLDCSVSTVHSYLNLAEDAGLITRVPRGAGQKDGTAYTLDFCSDLCSESEPKKSSSSGGTKPPPLRGGEQLGGGAASQIIPDPVSYDVILRHRMRVARTARAKNRWAGSCVYCHQKVHALEGVLVDKLPAHKECDTQVMAGKWKDDPDNPDNWVRGEAEFGERPEAPKVTTLASDPAVRLARRFEHHWISVTLKADPTLQGMRVIDTGPAVGYLRTKMLKHMAPEWIEAYIETFCDEAGHGGVDFKEGQSAWQRFTGWWGTVEIDDPIRRREDAAMAQRVREQVRQRSGG